ncbi:hypothetical protein C900_05875 [Fulvivirga imtechensis AK7]|uniref:Uncharacterized protein n=1 Tax=Fulvivirga imtechensis AK7 TaxID=1237149 RepID=L8JKL0_9BACT|nr:hypothetical protein [Fulvivirga imtechensis]ELR68743.1 hypothetical protein C900_05875 [Fulvivirga imtechensis AK7]
MLIKLIKEKRFEEAYKQVDIQNFKPYYDEILSAVFVDEDMCHYEFLNYIIENHRGDALMHYYAAELMSTALNFMPNGYKIAFDHAMKAIELNPSDISLKEYALLFYEVPDRLLDEQKAKELALEVLKANKESEAAKRVLS